MIKNYKEEENPVLWNASIYANDNYSDELGYFHTKAEAETRAKEELEDCEKSEYVYGAYAYVRAFGKTRALENIVSLEREISFAQTEIDTIQSIIKGK